MKASLKSPTCVSETAHRLFFYFDMLSLCQGEGEHRGQGRYPGGVVVALVGPVVQRTVL